MSSDFGPQDLERLAPEASVADLVRPLGLEDRLRGLWIRGLEPGASPGWPSLANLWTLRKGEWTLISGRSHHGKSAFTDAVMVNLATDQDWRWGLISLEKRPHEIHLAALAELYIGKPFNTGPRARMSEHELARAVRWIDGHFTFVAPPEDEETVSRILAAVDILRATDERLDGLVIDPWNELTHHMGTDREDQYLAAALKRIRRFAQDREMHVIVVAHPRTAQPRKDGSYGVAGPQDVSGGVMWWNKADNALCVWRDLDVPGETTVYVQKIRNKFVGHVGECTLLFDRATNRYRDAQAGLDEPFRGQF
jgi:twinkle protein